MINMLCNNRSVSHDPQQAMTKLRAADVHKPNKPNKKILTKFQSVLQTSALRHHCYYFKLE